MSILAVENDEGDSYFFCILFLRFLRLFLREFLMLFEEMFRGMFMCLILKW